MVDQPRAVDGERAERDDDRGDAGEGDEDAVDEAEPATDGHRECDREDRGGALVRRDELAGDVRGYADNRADREVDVAREDDDRLGGGEDGRDGDARRDPGEEAAAQVVVDEEAEQDDRGGEDDEQRELAQPLGTRARQIHSTPIAAPTIRSSVASPRV